MTALTEAMRNEIEQMIRDAPRNPDEDQQMPFAPRRRVEEELMELKAKIVAVEDQIKEYEAKIAKMTAEKESRPEGKKGPSVGEFVLKKSMTPTTLKDGSGFKTWREAFNRWIEVNQAGMKEVLKELAKGGEIKQEDIQRKCGKDAEGPGWI